MYDGIATLIGYGEPTYDSYGNETIPEIETEVFVQPRGVYHSEFYSAAQLGLKPSVTLFLSNRCDYDGQKVVLYERRVYEVIRVDWTAQRDGISLICEERTDGHHNSSTAEDSE